MRTRFSRLSFLLIVCSWLGVSSCTPLFDMARSPFGDTRPPLTVTTSSLNVRQGPGMRHRIIGVLQRGEPVDVRGEQRGWRRIALERRGKVTEGWVAAKYLKTAAAPKPPAAKAEPIKAEPKVEPKPVVRKKPVVERAPVVAARPPAPRKPLLRGEPAGVVPLEFPDPAPPEVASLDREGRLDPSQETDRPEPIAPLSPPAPVSPPEETAADGTTKDPARPPAPSAGASRVEAGPYGEEIRPLRDAFAEKRFADAEGKLAILHSSTRRSRVANSPVMKFFSILERGSIDLDRGRLDNSIRRFGEARELAAQAAEAEGDGSGEPGGFFFSSRKEESATPASYRPTAFESLWIGNSLALAHLLAGNRDTDQLVLAEIDRQEALDRAAETELRSLEESLRDEGSRVGEAEADAVQEIIERDYEASGLRAEAAAGSLVSPFAYYLAGVVQELEARTDPARREDALAAYAKALELAPNDLFRAAVDDLSSPDPGADDRLVHVLVADGFVPEKKTIIYPLSLPGRSLEVRLPVLEPSPVTVSGASLTIDGTATELPLSAIADVEAMALRYERDRTPERALAVLRALPDPPRTASVGGIADWIGGSSKSDASASAALPPPETASWMMLPARYYAARLRLSKAPHKLKIALLDAAGTPVDAVEVTLDPNAHSFIYVRSAGRILTTRARSPDWFAEKPAP